MSTIPSPSQLFGRLSENRQATSAEGTTAVAQATSGDQSSNVGRRNTSHIDLRRRRDTCAFCRDSRANGACVKPGLCGRSNWRWRGPTWSIHDRSCLVASCRRFEAVLLNLSSIFGGVVCRKAVSRPGRVVQRLCCRQALKESWRFVGST